MGMRKVGEQYTPDTIGAPSSEDIYRRYSEKRYKQSPLVDELDASKVSGKSDVPGEQFDFSKFGQGAARGMSGGVGSAVMMGGLTTGNPYVAGAGAGLMLLEQDSKSKQIQAEAEAKEAQERKQAQLSAINSAISVSKGLGV